MRRLLRLLLVTTVLAAPGCIVVTCGTTRTVDEQGGAGEVTEPVTADTGRGAGSSW